MSVILRRANASSAGPRSSRSQSRPVRFRTYALFGWGKNYEKDQEREEQYRTQMELLERRRRGETLKDADVRRSNVRVTLETKKAERKRERDLLAQGIMPDTLRDWKPYMKKEDEEANSGIVVPLLPFGNRKYDEGERFDLRSPYADDGWVDPEETDAFAGIKNFGKKFLNFGGRREPEERKPIIWASDWGRYLQEKKEQAMEKREGNVNKE